MNLRGLWTLFGKEVLRFRRVALQTLAAPAVAALLYLVVLQPAQAARGEALAFVVPGLAMMAILQNAFANSSSSLIQSKQNGNLVFLLLSPLSPLEIFLGFTLAAALRGALVAVAVVAAALPFAPLPLHGLGWVAAFTLVGGAALGALGLVAALWADRFEQLAGIQSFVVLPLTFLAGVFHPLDALPGRWRAVAACNPFFYLVDGLRYGFLGRSQVSPGRSLAAATLALAAISTAALLLLRRGYKIRA